MKNTNLNVSNTGIKDIVIDEICNLAEKYDIEKVYLFGSRARGDYKERSDIDLATVGGKHIEFSFDVDELTSTLLKYDMVDLDGTVQEELRNSIMKEGKLLYEKI